jgi:Bacterial lipoate protein ligase C-terminus
VKRFEYKVPGGKLLRVKLEVEAEKIKFLQLTGDFFMQPETDLEELEAQLISSPIDLTNIENAIHEFFSKKKTVITGASPSDFAYVINHAVKS